jgi:cell division protein ZapA
MCPDKRIEIPIQGQVFKLRCPEGEEERLREAAKLVEEKIAELTQSTGLVDSFRTALMAAFHLAYEVISREEKSFRHSAEYRKIQKRLKTLVEEIDTHFGD